MKPCCVCTLIGVACGMALGCYLMLQNPKFKQFVKQSKSTIEQKVQEMQSKATEQD